MQPRARTASPLPSPVNSQLIMQPPHGSPPNPVTSYHVPFTIPTILEPPSPYTPPSQELAEAALANLLALLRPHKANGHGYLPFDGDELLKSRIQQMVQLLTKYTMTKTTWITASKEVTEANKAILSINPQTLRKWTWAYIDDHDDLPFNYYGTWQTSLVDDKDSFASAALEYLLSQG